MIYFVSIASAMFIERGDPNNERMSKAT